MIRLFIGCSLCIFTLAFFGGAPKPVQDLDAWKAALNAAQNNRGCESIPYSNYRDLCQRRGELVEEFCKIEKWSCKGLETRALRGNIKNLSEKIESLKSQKDRLSSQRSSASTDSEKSDIDRKISDLDREIYDKSKELDFMKKSLDTDISDIGIRLYQGGKCLDARTEVQNAFKDASSDANRENDNEIRAIGKQLIEYWSKKRDDHEQAFRNTKEGLDYCKGSRDGDL
jgi:predicted RNase H-like nuclease (RuvC/YqgF family)